MNRLSKRQLMLRFGFNQKHVETLLREGVLVVAPGCTYLRPKLTSESVASLREGEHYVVCRCCGAFQAQITSKHLRACSGQTLVGYQSAHPDAPIMSALCSGHKAKTDEQRQHQAGAMQRHFSSDAGKMSRQKISVAAKRMHANGYRDIAVRNLREWGNSSEGKSFQRNRMLSQWVEGSAREVVEGWHREHREQSHALAAKAREHLTHTNTAPHRLLRAALQAAGIDSVSEFPFGYYLIDEAIPEHKIAVEADGCYWHGCKECGFEPRADNKKNDRAKNSFLRNRGWVVLRFPEHRIKADVASCVEEVLETVRARRAA